MQGTQEKQKMCQRGKGFSLYPLDFARAAMVQQLPNYRRLLDEPRQRQRVFMALKGGHT